MKYFALFALICIASAANLCPVEIQGLTACFARSGTSENLIENCKTYGAPLGDSGDVKLICDACYDGYNPNTAKTSCSIDSTKYLGYAGIGTSTQKTKDAELGKLKLVRDLDPKDGISWTTQSCAKDGQVQLKCADKYFYNSATWKCDPCTDSTNCLQCSDASTCTKCAAGTFLSDKTCVACDSSGNQLVCASKDAVKSCKSGFYVKENKCAACPSNAATCSSDTVPTTCKAGFYLKTADDDAKTKTCEACGVEGVRQCTGAVTTGKADNVVECNEYDGTYYYYKTTKGCIKHLASSRCKTISEKTTDNWECATCFANNYLNGHESNMATCIPCSGNTFNASGDDDTKALKECTSGSSTKAATVTCNTTTGYYPKDTDGKCYKCTAPASECKWESSTEVQTKWEGSCGDDDKALVSHYTDDDGVTFKAEKATNQKTCEDNTPGTYLGYAEAYVNEHSGGDLKGIKCKDGYGLQTTYTGNDDVTFTKIDSPTNAQLPKCVANTSQGTAETYKCKKIKINTTGGKYDCEECESGYATVQLYGSDFETANKKGRQCRAIVTADADKYVAQANCSKYKKKGTDIQCVECADNFTLQITKSSADWATNEATTGATTKCIATIVTSGSTNVASSSDAQPNCKIFTLDGSDKKFCKKCISDSYTLVRVKADATFATETGFTASYCLPLDNGTPDKDHPDRKCLILNYKSAATFCKKCINETDLAIAKYKSTKGTYKDDSVTASYCATFVSGVGTADGNDVHKGCLIYQENGDGKNFCEKCKGEALLIKVHDETDPLTGADIESTSKILEAYCVAMLNAGDPGTEANPEKSCAKIFKKAAAYSLCHACKDGMTLAKIKGTPSSQYKKTDYTAGYCFTKIAGAADASASTAAKGCLEYWQLDFATTAGTWCEKCDSNGTLVEVTTTANDLYPNPTATNVTGSYCKPKSSGTATATAANEGCDEVIYNGTSFTVCRKCTSASAVLLMTSETDWTDANVTNAHCIAALSGTGKYVDNFACQSYDEKTDKAVQNCVCKAPHKIDSGKCVEVNIDKCIEGLTTGKCNKCQQGVESTTSKGTYTTVHYLKKEDGSECQSCNDADNKCAAITNLVWNTAKDKCICDTCIAGYYLDSDSHCTSDLPDNCHVLDPTVTKTAKCYACYVGYIWDTSATPNSCKKCDGTTYKCTNNAGCSGVAYPGSSTSSSSDSSNSYILSFMVTILVTLMTFLL